MSNPEAKIEVRALSALMALQSILHVFVQEEKLGAFVVEGLKAIPGCGPSSLCLRTLQQPVGDLRVPACTDCGSARQEIGDPAQSPCELENQEDVHTFSLQTSACFFGRLHISVTDREIFALYAPFLVNLASTLTVTLENRLQKQQLEQANQELLESEQSLCEAQHISRLGSWSLDLVRNEMKWSDEVYRIFGVTVDEFEPSYEFLLSRVHPEDRQQVDAVYSASVRQGTPFHIVHRVLWPNGALRFVEARCAHQLDAAGTVIKSLGAVQDITGRVLAEQELARYRDHLEALVQERTAELAEANIRLQELDRMKSLFMSSISHELRTPLNAIIGFTTIVRDGMSGEINLQQRDQLDRAVKSSRHLLSMVSDVIDISAIEAGQVKAELQPVVLAHLVAEALDQVRAMADKKGLRLAADIPADLNLITDQQRLLQCLNNLLTNGLKYSEHGTVKVSARPLEDGVTITVSDCGIGIAADDLAWIFSPFERLQTRLSVPAGGPGLGLYLTKKLVTEVLHGEIAVKSEVGKGSVFTIKIPG